jgi:hypothetical protein
MDNNDTDSKHWVDVPGWPRAHIYSDHGFRLLVLTDELETGLIDRGPIWLIVCPYCRTDPVAVPAKDVKKHTGNGKPPSCGCRKPGHENFQGDYRKIRTGDSLFG